MEIAAAINNFKETRFIRSLMQSGSRDNLDPNQGLCEALFFAGAERVQAIPRSWRYAIGHIAYWMLRRPRLPGGVALAIQ